MVTKEDVDKAWAAWEAAWCAAKAAYAAKAAKASAAEEEAWDKYVQLKEEYDNGIKSTED